MDGIQLLIFSLLALIGTISWGIFSYRHSTAGYLVVLGAFLTLFVPFQISIGPVDISIVDIGFAVYLVAVTIRLGRTGSAVILPFDRSYLVVIAFFVCTLAFTPFLGLIVWEYSPAVLMAGLRYLEWTLFLPLTAVIAQEDKRLEEWIPRLIAATIIIHGIAAVVQIIGAWQWWDQGYIMGSGRAIGLLPGPNQLGSYAAITLLIALSFLLYGRHREKAVLLPTIAGSVFLIFVSESRTGLVMAVGTTALMIGANVWEGGVTNWSDVKNVRYILIASFGLGIGLVVLELFIGGIMDGVRRFSELFLIVLDDPREVSTLASRVQIWEEALETYRQVGWHGSLVPAIFVTTATHNYYLSMLVQAGPLGLGAWLGLLVYTFRCGVWNFFATKSPIAFALIFVTVSIALGSLVRHPYVDPPIQILFWTLVGLSPTVYRPEAAAESRLKPVVSSS